MTEPVQWPLKMYFDPEGLVAYGSPATFRNKDIEVLVWPADQAPEPVAWRWRDPVDNTVGEWRSMPVQPIKIEPGETGFEYDYAYSTPPDLAKELAEVRVQLANMAQLVSAESVAREKAEAALERERERCAKICDEYPLRDPAEDGNGYWAAENCAAAIRNSRGDGDE